MTHCSRLAGEREGWHHVNMAQVHQATGRERGKQIDIQIDRQTYKYIGRHTDTDRQTEGQTDRKTYI